MLDGEQKFPKVTTGAVIVNQAGKIFLMRSPQWHNKLVIPGGHVDWGEPIIDCLKREVKEETGLTVRDPEFLRPVEFIFSPAYNSERHIIPLDYLVRTDDPEEAVKLDGREAVEYLWLTPEEIAGRDDVEFTTKEAVAYYQEREQLKRQCAEYKAGWQRAVADYQNLKKETEARRAGWAQYSEQMILAEFIPVYDNFKKAWNVEPFGLAQGVRGAWNTEQENWVKGIEYIKKQFGDILKAHEVEEIRVVGETFDPTRHESVGEEVAEGKAPGEIVREVEGGYTMGGKVIKPAKVIIAK